MVEVRGYDVLLCPSCNAGEIEYLESDWTADVAECEDWTETYEEVATMEAGTATIRAGALLTETVLAVDALRALHQARLDLMRSALEAAATDVERSYYSDMVTNEVSIIVGVREALRIVEAAAGPA